MCSAHGDDLQPFLAYLRHEPPPDDYNEAELNTFRAFGVTPPKRAQH